MLAVAAPLDGIKSVAFDPRFRQEVLITQIILRENYGGRPVFTPVDPSISAQERLASHDAALLALADSGAAKIVLDLGQEWLDVTLRPMVWGLVAARAGELDAASATEIAAFLRAVSLQDGWQPNEAGRVQFTLDGYAMDGLEELVQHLFYHGSFNDVPGIAFIDIAEAPKTLNGPVD